MAYAEVRALVRDRPTRALSEADPDTRDGPGEQRRAERLRHQQGGRQDRDGDGDERQPQRRRRLVARQYPVANPSMAPRAAGVPRRRRIVPAGMIMLKPTKASSVPTVATGHQDPCPPVSTRAAAPPGTSSVRHSGRSCCVSSLSGGGDER